MITLTAGEIALLLGGEIHCDSLDELTTIGRNINESNLNGQEIDDVHREYLLKKFKSRRGEIAS